MKYLIFLTIFLSKIYFAESTLIFKGNDGEKSYENYGVPFIVLSATFISNRSKSNYTENYVLSVLNDGSCFLNVTSNNQNNELLPKEKRKLDFNKFGPKILPEKVRAVLQKFFSSSYNLSLIPKAYTQNFLKDKNGAWLAELKLSYEANEHMCYFSSTEKNLPLISIEGEEFLIFLHQIIDWMKQSTYQN